MMVSPSGRDDLWAAVKNSGVAAQGNMKRVSWKPGGEMNRVGVGLNTFTLRCSVASLAGFGGKRKA